MISYASKFSDTSSSLLTVLVATACIALCLNSPTAVSQDLRIDSVEMQLDRSNCQAPNTSWSQVAGSKSAEIQQSQSGASVILFEKGYYQFELNCCSGASNSDPIESLMSSPSLIGYGEKTTGGAAATSLTRVTTLNDSGPGSLREALTAKGPRWIVFDESIHGGTIYLLSLIHI